MAGEVYPALEVPETAIRAHGTENPEADAALASGLAPTGIQEVTGDWGWVLGDLVVLRQPHRAVPPLDDYEDFKPGAKSLFDRVLTTVDTGEDWVLAWTYTKAPGTACTSCQVRAGPVESCSVCNGLFIVSPNSSGRSSSVATTVMSPRADQAALAVSPPPTNCHTR